MRPIVHRTPVGVMGWIVSVVSLALGCTGRQSPQTEPVAAPVVIDLPGARPSAPLMLGQSSTLPGTTNVDVMPHVMFEIIQGVHSVTHELDVRDLSARASFVDSRGRVITARATKVEAQRDPLSSGTSPQLEFVPTQELDKDQWYWFLFKEARDVRILDPSRYGDLFASHFFTGSAPRIIGVEASLKSPTMRLTFSEPVDVSSLGAPEAMRFANGTAGACIHLNGACRRDDISAALMTFVNVSVSAALDDAVKGELVLDLAPGLKGASRTAGEGAKVAASAIRQVIPAAGWVSCSDGFERCWRDRLAPPGR